MKESKKIEFTDDQFKSLVKLIFYGDWILHANKIGDEGRDKSVEGLVEYIYSQKEKFSLKSWFKELKYGEELNERVTMLLLEKVFEYNEETFWFYLIKKLSLRDAINEHLEKGGKITDEEYIEDLQWKYEKKYEKLFGGKEIDDFFLKED